MKVVILAGGLGTRLSEETVLKPKPMVEIGGMPILWHIMKSYSHFGFQEFIICLGYKGYLIKEYFSNYSLHMSDLTIDMKKNTVNIHNNRSEDWKITFVDTGENSMTGGRLKRLKPYLGLNEDFFFTYGDGLSDINFSKELEFHKSHSKFATVAAVIPPGRFGALELEDNKVIEFKEKPQGDGALINGGFFILNSQVLDLIEGDNTTWENEPLEELSRSGNLYAYKHTGFWQPMDTLREKNYLEKLWNSDQAPWKVWD